MGLHTVLVTSCARQQQRSAWQRASDPVCGLVTCGHQSLHRVRKGIEGKREGRDSATIDSIVETRGVHPGKSGDRVGHKLLHRVIARNVSLRVVPEVLGHGQERGVLPGTTIVNGFKVSAGADELVGPFR